MRIKRIEIIGFKSFCDRTVLNFNEPVTGVVGPNGCGKSNIVDAIRWCMGEQSPKHLRGQAMADVIFNGSEKRGPAGMAQVSLTFEDVGFSHEALEVSSEQDSILEDPILEGVGAESEEAGENSEEEKSGDEVESVSDSSSEPETAESEVEETQVSGVPTPDIQPELAPGEDDEIAKVSAQAKKLTEEAREVLTESAPDIDFSQYTEVTISRRLFRDGTSGYFLNNTPCRLRDITDFFLGTGVGTKAYSIIEQGRIGMIVSSRPQDRRNMIEEAAGITKFKTKKRAAERKLGQTRQNLLRVTDIVDELGSRMGSLRRQAQKAERYRRYREEVRDIELWKASHKFLEQKGQKDCIVGSLGRVREGLETSRSEFTVKDAAIVAERADLSVEERRLAAVQEQIYELENRIKLGESKVEFQRREASDLEARVSGASTEVENVRNLKNSAGVDIDSQREQRESLDGNIETATSTATDREGSFETLRAALRDAQSQLDEARNGIAQAQGSRSAGEARREAIERRRQDSTARRDRIKSESDQVNERVETLSKSVGALEEELAGLRQTRLSLGTRNEAMEARRLSLAEACERDGEKIEVEREELHRKRSRLQSLEEIHDRYEGFARGTRAVMQNRQTALGGSDTGLAGEQGKSLGLVADLVNAPKEFETAVEAALGERLGAVLVQSTQGGIEGVRYLSESGAGRSAFLPISDYSADASSFQEFASAPGVVGRLADLVEFEAGHESLGVELLGNVLVVESLERAVELRAQGAKALLVTRTGDTVDPCGLVRGGSAESEGASVLSQKREMRELNDVCAQLEETVVATSARLVAAKDGLRAVVSSIEGLRSEVHDGELAARTKEQERSGAQSELERLRQRAARLDAETIELNESIEGLLAEEAELGETIKKAERSIDENERRQIDLLDRVTQEQLRVEEAQQGVTEAKVEVAQLGEKKASLESSILRLQNTERELSERLGKLETGIAEDKGRCESLRRDASEVETELVEVREQRQKLAMELSGARSNYETRVAELEVKDHEARGLRQAADKLSSEYSALEVRLESIEVNLQHLGEGMRERYQVVLDEEIYNHHLRPMVTNEVEERLVERKRLLERMGSDINLTAIDEFKDVSTRHDFLAGQKDDLESAVSQLEKAIAKINKTSRKLFRDTFNAINENFSKTFPRLFRGGKAKLALTGGDDVDLLEAGVEIMAQPPGKKNVTVDQLSGGEKALTAVALIFSIFLIKPSPFCLLDEVDAPLDEANVDRYNQILREMTDRSQFIVITHNKRTMGVADTLYGVTMEEPGVSKLVSVDIGRVASASAAA